MEDCYEGIGVCFWKFFRSVLFCLIVAIVGLFGSLNHASGSVVRVGVLAQRGTSICYKRWGPLAAYLNKKIPGERFEIVPLKFDEVMNAAKKRRVDFMLVNPFYYVVMERCCGAKSIATLKNRLSNGRVTHSCGGVVFRRADRRDIPPFSRLRGVRFCAIDPEAFGGWLAVLYDLKECGIDPKRDFARVVFLGTYDAVVQAVWEGKADVGAVGTGVLERMAEEGKIRFDECRIIHVTRHFPNWPFVKLRHVPEDLARNVAVTLLGMSSSASYAKAAQCAGWEIPSNYHSVRECLKALGMGLFQNNVALTRIVHRYWLPIAGAAFLFGLMLAGLIVAVRYGRIVKKQRDKIQRETEIRIQAMADYRQSERRFEDLVFALGDWVWEVDEKGRYTYCSGAVSDILGYSPEAFIGKTPFDFMPEDEAERVRGILEESIRGKKPIKDLENWNLTQSGERVCLLTNGAPILDARGNLKGYRGVDKDITESKVAQQRLAQIHRCLSGLGTDYLENVKSIVETTGEILGACCAYYHELTEEGLTTIYAWRAPEDFGKDPGEGTICYHTLRQVRGGALVVPHLKDSRYGLEDPRIRELDLNFFVGHPIFVEGEPKGVLCTFFKGDSRPVQQAVNLLGVLGEAISKELERHLFSRKLKEREEFLGTLIESAIDTIVVMDLDRRIVEVNRAFCGMFGFDREEVIGQSIACIHVSKEKASEFAELIYPVVREKGFWRGEWELRRKDGGIIPIETVTAVLKEHKKGEEWGYVAFIRDITERKHAEEALKEAHAQLTQIVSAIHSILIGLSSEGTVTLWNGVSENVLGLKTEDVLGSPLASCNISWEWRKIEEGIQRCKERKEIVSVGDVQFAGPEREKGVLGMSIDPVFNAEGKFVGMLILAVDITEKRVMEAQLFQAQKMESIGQLAAGIAHEINTPTQFIGDNLNFLRDAFEDLGQLMEKHAHLVERVKAEASFPDLVRELETLSEEIDVTYLLEEIPKTLEQSLEGVKRVSKIVRAMKEFSHPGVKEKVMVDLNKSVETTLTVTKNAWKYVAEVETQLDPNMAPVPCMPDEINQVLLNLIVNAAQAIEGKVNKTAGEKGKIIVSTYDRGDWVEIRVRDTGSGIPREIQNRIFDPFFTTKEVGKGTGQGLSIVHDTVVNKHGGQIYFETEQGVGTTFVVLLPKNPESEGIRVR